MSCVGMTVSASAVSRPLSEQRALTSAIILARSYGLMRELVQGFAESAVQQPGGI